VDTYTSSRVRGSISPVVIGVLSRYERNAYELQENQRSCAAENFKATKTIVRQRSRAYAFREAAEGAQTLANARAPIPLITFELLMLFLLFSFFIIPSFLAEETESR